MERKRHGKERLPSPKGKGSEENESGEMHSLETAPLTAEYGDLKSKWRIKGRRRREREERMGKKEEKRLKAKEEEKKQEKKRRRMRVGKTVLGTAPSDCECRDPGSKKRASEREREEGRSNAREHSTEGERWGGQG